VISEHALREKFLEQIQIDFPAFSAQDVAEQLGPLVSDQLLSPFHISLPKKVLQQAQAFVKAAFQLRQMKSYTSLFADELKRLQLQEPGNNSILMSYDFHLDSTGQLKLIEINTNASFLALSDVMYKVHRLPTPIPDFNMQEIQSNILQELQLNGAPTPSDLSIAIIDENPQEQKLFAEFLLYAEHFKSWGWKPVIADFRKLPGHFDFIYNRTTDFLFSESASSHLRELLNSRKSTISPNPLEYIYLASKSRIVEWSQPGFLQSVGLSPEMTETLLSALPRSFILNSTNAAEVWAQKKQLFFKPLQSFGSKQTYRGSKITKKTFEEISSQDFLAQEYVAPSEVEQETPTGPQNFKYDLRFYAYQDRVQSVIARIYQGQVTNLRTPLGGFACVKIQ
jgi:hypothetical protein